MQQITQLNFYEIISAVQSKNKLFNYN